MLVDDDSALILGRELLGFPKKLGAFTHDLADDGTGSASVARGAVTLLALTARAPRPAPAAAGVFTDPIVNVVASPTLALGVLWRMTVRERIHRALGVDLDHTVAGTPHDPLTELGVGARSVPGLALLMDLAVPPPRPGFVPPVWPVGLVPPTWLYAHLPFRTL
jgi:acetoacetate decarboxylase